MQAVAEGVGEGMLAGDERLPIDFSTPWVACCRRRCKRRKAGRQFELLQIDFSTPGVLVVEKGGARGTVAAEMPEKREQMVPAELVNLPSF